MKHLELILSICFVGVVILLCTHSEFVSTSFADGLQLWYNRLVPVLLPFLLLSGLFLSMLDLHHPNKIVCLILLFLCGLFCGYPVGAIAIEEMYQHGMISRRFAHAILPLNNNVSPMFLIGYIYQPYFAGRLPLLPFLCVIYLPQIVYAVCFCMASHMITSVRNGFLKKSSPSAEELAATERSADAKERDSVIENSIRTITVIGIYIAIFSVIYDAVLEFGPDISFLKTAACFLEITKGIPQIAAGSLDAVKKTALLLSLTAFGGLSSLFQSMHVLKNTDLSFLYYMSGKIICSVMTFLCTVYLL